jgi:hypothetical protein
MSDVTPRSRSLFQVSVAVAVIGVLAAALLNALHYVQEKAERTVMEATVRNMGKGLEIELQTRVIRGRPGSSRELVGANPIQWLESPPEGYGGSGRRGSGVSMWPPTRSSIGRGLPRVSNSARREGANCAGEWVRLTKPPGDRGRIPRQPVQLGWFPRHLLSGTDIDRLICFALSVFWRPLVECTVVDLAEFE